MRFDTIIQGGQVVTPRGIERADVGIRGEKIAAISPELAGAPQAATSKIIDARGHYVLPGVIDVHTHLDLPIGPGVTTADDWASGTRAAARGGVTTVIDFATPEARPDRPGGVESLDEAIDNWFRRAESRALIDYAFHVAITRWSEHRRQLEGVFRRGFPTFKEYMIYESRGLQSDDAALFSTLERLRDLGGMLMVHAESARVLDELIARHHTPAEMRRFGAQLHAITRPNFIEAEAIQRAIFWAEATRGPLYIVHTSTGAGAELVRRARERRVCVAAETCPHYLALDDSVYARRNGHLFACSPQMKKPADSHRLWRGLREGEISAVATDTCSFTRAQKDAWGGDFTRIPNGLPGLETLLPILWTRGVLGRRLGIERLCEVLSTLPAKMMGLYPRKGAIIRGADADLAIVHPRRRLRVDPSAMESRAGWSPYDGWQLAGFPRTVLSRGEVIVENYSVLAGLEGRGRFLPRAHANPLP